MDGYGPAQIGQAIARALAEAMERQGLSANALASAAGVNRQAITYVLRGDMARHPDGGELGIGPRGDALASPLRVAR